MKIQKILALVLVFSLCMSLLTGCATTSTTAPAKNTATSSAPVEEASASASVSAETSAADDSTDAETSADTSAEASVTTEPTATYDTTTKMDVTHVDFDALNQLSNDPISYGYALDDRDSLNRPNGLYYYDKLYADTNSYTHVDTEEKVVYLTMDEGYENGCTPEILDTLKEKGVHAVFPITKQFFDENPNLIQRMIDEGHIVANHTCAHPSGGMPQLGTQGMYEDIKQLNDLVYEKFGYQMKLFRFPEGVASKRAVALLNQMGYKTLFWSFAYKDYDTSNQPNTSEALQKCLDQIHPGAIYLLHAVSTTNTAILGDFIDGARALGYEFGDFPVE